MITRNVLLAFALCGLSVNGFGQALTGDRKAKVEAKAQTLKSWGSDPAIVAAVKAHNSSPDPATKAMTNEKWASLTLLDPFVRSFGKNALGQHLKSKQSPEITECFVSGADGTKVAFLSKPTSWSHADKDKHRKPMTGSLWIGSAETDESSGQLQVQVGVPVMDGGKAIGSIVIGLKVSEL